MFLKLPYGNKILPFTIPEKNLLYIAEPATLPVIENIEDELYQLLDKPFGSPALAGLAATKKNVLILVDDLTRSTPVRSILPPLCRYLHRLGFETTQVSIIIALGTHRPMTAMELKERLGDEIFHQYHIFQSDAGRDEDYLDLGITNNGTPVQVHKEVCRAEFKIGIGNITPHVMAGWSGGAKIIQPGVCGVATTAATHLLGVKHESVLTLAGNIESIVRKEMTEVAREVGLDFIINTVLDTQGRPVGLFAGDFDLAHREGVKLAEKVFRPTIPALADVVLCSAYPADRDYWQGFKPFGYAHFGVRYGGTIIFAIAAEEGLSGNAPTHDVTLRTWSTRTEEEIRRAVMENRVKDQIGVSVPWGQARLRGHAAEILCYSDGLNSEDIKALGFRETPDLQVALDNALQRYGPGATVGVIPYGGETVVQGTRKADENG